MAAKAMPRSASSRSALGATMAALLPPSSRICAGEARGQTRRRPRGPWRWSRWLRPAPPGRGRPARPPCRGRRAAGREASRRVGRSGRWRAPNRACTASAVSGVFSDGFHTTASPQTSASAAFQAQTATGKLKAEMTPTTPSGCQVSIMRCCGRSVAMVSPCSWRDRPTAKSQMSIISCTSPRPSETILPASSVTSRPRSALAARSSSPSRRTSSPRRGAGTIRQARKAAWARSIRAAASVGETAASSATISPVSGERATRPSARPRPAASRPAGTPQRSRRAAASSETVMSAVLRRRGG